MALHITFCTLHISILHIDEPTMSRQQYTEEERSLTGLAASTSAASIDRVSNRSLRDIWQIVLAWRNAENPRNNELQGIRRTALQYIHLLVQERVDLCQKVFRQDAADGLYNKDSRRGIETTGAYEKMLGIERLLKDIADLTSTSADEDEERTQKLRACMQMSADSTAELEEMPYFRAQRR